jgi:hypothetical protein
MKKGNFVNILLGLVGQVRSQFGRVFRRNKLII